jgi:CDP-L-myo-inositol myo-inositolphosphotransferase
LITLTILKYDIPLTPNHVSLISFGLGLLAALLYAYGHYVTGAILVELSSIIDGVDGELAGAKRMMSARGGFLDTMLDRFVDISIYLGILIFLIRQAPSALPLISLIAVLADTGDLLVTYLHAAGELKFGRHPALVGVIPPFASRDVRLFIIFIGTLLGFATETLIAVAVVSYAYVVVKFVELLMTC